MKIRFCILWVKCIYIIFWKFDNWIWWLFGMYILLLWKIYRNSRQESIFLIRWIYHHTLLIISFRYKFIISYFVGNIIKKIIPKKSIKYWTVWRKKLKNYHFFQGRGYGYRNGTNDRIFVGTNRARRRNMSNWKFLNYIFLKHGIKKNNLD